MASEIDRALKDGVASPVSVVGQVSGFRERTHWYFDLKDEEAVVGAVMFASAARKAGFVPADGQEVVVRGRVEFWAKGGRTSFLVSKIEPVGVGALELAYRKLCEEIRGLGWFDVVRKRALPMAPGRVAVVTSVTGAALQDVIDTMGKRWPATELVVVDARVQGEGSGEEVARAIRAVSGASGPLGIDALLVTRGGGSMEDLWAFNEKVVAEAIVTCAVPVVAAIGHETDTTIAELVADVRCATPTQAAMRLTPDREDVARQVDTIAKRLRTMLAWSVESNSATVEGLAGGLAGALRLAVEKRGRALDRVSGRLEALSPARRHAELVRRLESGSARLAATLAMRVGLARRDQVATGARLVRVLERRRVRARDRAGRIAEHLSAIAPERVLDRGYSWTTGADGKLVRSVGGVEPGERLRTRVADGEFRSVVEGAGRRRASKKRSAVDDSIGGLFD